MVKPLDIVIAGPDGSGTSTQIGWFVEHLKSHNLKIKDLRGSEVDVLWHARENPVNPYAQAFESFPQFQAHIHKLGIAKSTSEPINLVEFRKELETLEGHEAAESKFLRWSANRIRETPYQNPSLAAMTPLKHGTYIDASDSDVWLMEEPSYRLSGLHNRFFEQYRSSFGAPQNQRAAANAHALYRESEFYRFRKHILDAGKITLRSRSEESACYQMYDELLNPTGPKMEEYIHLPGHEIAFRYAPTHIFVAHGPVSWTVGDVKEFAKQRMGGRLTDDYENNSPYQHLIDKRYSGDFLDRLYSAGTKEHGGTMPLIIRFDMTTPKDKLKELMVPALQDILTSSGYIKSAREHTD